MIPFNIIVAVDSQNGIGKNGQLPWHLPGDMKHFKEITVATKDKAKQNAVIMGRKTWDSIPEKFRPLPNRLNIVITRNKNLSLPAGVMKAESVEKALQLVQKNQHADGKIESIFIIGGGEIFRESLAHPDCHKIYLTSINYNFQCDTFLPEFSSQYKKSSQSAPLTEENISYQFSELIKL